MIWNKYCPGIIACLLFTTICFAQVTRDSILANERALDRPLNVHKGQLRVSGFYSYSYLGKRYSDGSSMQLKPEGLARARHIGQAEIKYGISEYIQFTALLGLQRENIREQQLIIFGYPDLESLTFVNTIHAVSGLNDIAIGLDFRVPFRNRKFDLLFSGAAILPIDNYQQSQPNHSLTESAGLWMINYEFDRPVSRGCVSYRFGGGLKYRLDNFGITLQGHYTLPSKTVTQVEWRHQLNNQNEFEYQSTEYTLANSNELWSSLILELQASPFVSVQFETNLQKWTGGWTEENGISIQTKDKMALMMGPGFELIITPRLWFRQFVLIPVSGKNIDLGTGFYSALNYNIFVTK